jgi:hypothetical protein
MASGDYPFYAGKKYADRETAPFRVTQAGKLYASDAVIDGDFYAYDELGSLVGKFATEGTGAAAAAYLQLNNTKTGVGAFQVYADLSTGGNQTFVNESFRVWDGSGTTWGSIQFEGGVGLHNPGGVPSIKGPMLYLYSGETGVGNSFVLGQNYALFLTQTVGIGTANPNSAYKLDVNGAVNTTGLHMNGTAGVSGTFTDKDGKTVAVSGGIITGIS